MTDREARLARAGAINVIRRALNTLPESSLQDAAWDALNDLAAEAPPEPPTTRQCERCGGTGQQGAGLYNASSHAYDAQAGICDDCGGRGRLEPPAPEPERPDPNWFQRQAARVEADRAALPEWLKEPERPAARCVWQPIETAPKDGTRILLKFKNAIIEGWWEATEWRQKWEVVALDSHGCGCCATDNPDPIAWMPLP